ncbi:MAG: hypothetical protein IPJ19_11375 [Planctomycetes bacterium]|nr:hypothetical protein [Planctomycetota bacterium]
MRIALASAAGDALTPRLVAALRGAGAQVAWFGGGAPLRSDLHPGHWQKSWHPATARALRKLLREERIEVLHVLHWRALSRDLVHAAARERVPALLSLQDASATCLLGTRVLPEGGPCDAPAGPNPCLSCAARVEPRTPWIPPDAQFLARFMHQQDLERELRLARALLVHDAEGREHARRFLGGFEVLEVPTAQLDDALLARRMLELYAEALSAGAPDAGAAENPYATLLAEASAREWDAAAARAGS